MRRALFMLALGVFSLLVLAPPSEAQYIGQFRWQTDPYCNVLVANISYDGPDALSITGWDDGCGASFRDAMYGALFFNSGGTVGGGLTIVSAGGAAQHFDIVVDGNTLSGTWSSSDGTSGTLIPQ